MTYQEIFQRLQLLFPDVPEGMITTIFNQGSEIFQRDTNYGLLTSITVPKAKFSSGSCSDYTIVSLESVSVNGEKYNLVYLNSKDISGDRVQFPEKYFYAIFGNEINLYYSGDTGYLSMYAPTSDVKLTGKFINSDNLITEDTTIDSEFDNTLAINTLFYVYANLYKLDAEKLQLAQYYEVEFNKAVKQFRKYGLSANRPATVQGSW